MAWEVLELRSVCVRILAESICLVVLPEAVVNFAIGVNESTTYVGLIPLLVALINAAIGPDLHAASMTNARICFIRGSDGPLAVVLRTIGQHLRVPVLNLNVAEIIFALLETVLEILKPGANHLNILPLLFEPDGIHLNVHEPMITQTRTGFEPVNMLDVPAGAPASNHRLHPHDEVNRHG